MWTFGEVEPGEWGRNRIVNILDILQVLGRFGPSPGPKLDKQAALAEALTAPKKAPPAYHASYDRGPFTGSPLNMGPPDGHINIVDDILGIARQFGHDCRPKGG